MGNFSIQIKELKKTFGRRLIFSNINIELLPGTIFGITGANGSGKSTLIKIIAGLNSPTSGKIVYKNQEKTIEPEKLHNFIGFVSPYLVLYDEFSAWENLNYFAKIRDIKFNSEKIEHLLNQFLLYNRKDDLLKTYSSGMKQRMKFIFALMHSPELVLLDEPTSNLDDEGKESVYQIIENEGRENIIIVASNEKSDLQYCKEKIKLEDFKN